jgi:hypothetical protein
MLKIDEQYICKSIAQIKKVVEPVIPAKAGIHNICE